MRASTALAAITVGLTPSYAALAERQTGTVEVQVLIETPRGSAVSANSIEIALDGTRRQVVSVRPTGGPLNLLVVLDASDHAMVQSFQTYDGRDYRLRMAKALDGDFLRKLRPDDRVRFGAFGSALQLSPAFISDRRTGSTDALTALQLPANDRRGMQPIWDIVIEAMRILAKESGPKALILYSTGEGTGNMHSLDDAIDTAQQVGVPVHVVSAAIDLVIPQARITDKKQIAVTSLLYSRPSKGLRELAAATGGLFVHAPGADQPAPYPLPFTTRDSYPHTNRPPRWENPGKGFSEVAGRLPSSHLVRLETSGLSQGFHGLSVRTSTPDLRVHAPSRLFVRE